MFWQKRNLINIFRWYFGHFEINWPLKRDIEEKAKKIDEAKEKHRVEEEKYRQVCLLLDEERELARRWVKCCFHIMYLQYKIFISISERRRTAWLNKKKAKNIKKWRKKITIEECEKNFV
jgi:hypothetical protein